MRRFGRHLLWIGGVVLLIAACALVGTALGSLFSTRTNIQTSARPRSVANSRQYLSANSSTGTPAPASGVAEHPSNTAVDEPQEGSTVGPETAAVDERARLAAVHTAVDELRAKARDVYVAKAPEVPSPEAAEASGPKTGIEHTHQGPFPASLFQVEDSWTGRIGKGYVVVYAGGELDPASEKDQVTYGGVRVYSELSNLSLGMAPSFVGTFRAPTGAELLTITNKVDDDLTLRGTAGRTFTFNAITDTYGGLRK